MANERTPIYADAGTGVLPTNMVPATVATLAGTETFTGAKTMAARLTFSGTTNAGLVVNNLNSTEINALTSPTSGIVLYNTTSNVLQFRNNTGWVGVIDAVSAQSLGGNKTFTSRLLFSGTANSGLAVNSLTTTERDALATPPNGTIIYNTTTLRINVRQNGAWNGLNDFSDGTRVVTAAGNITVAISDHLIVVRKATGEATTLTLPAGSTIPVGKEFVVKDGKGDAATNNITVNVSGGGNIDGATTQVIATNRGSFSFVWDGTEYIMI